MPKIKVLSRETVYKSFFNVDELKLQFGTNEEPVKRSLVVTRDASGILLQNTDTGNLIFSRQHRLGAIDQPDPYLIEIPAGVVDKGETPEQCARREALEETGFEVSTIEKIGSFYPSPGYTNEKINLFYCTTSNKLKHNNGGGLDGEHEFIEILEITLEDAMKMLETGEICDSKTAIALMWLERKSYKS
jgi:nudix-type nucleoside diphosphatase (YffH/AdpP family)